MLPFKKIPAYCMAPVHRSPYRGVGIILVKKMILPGVIYKAIGIICPHLRGRKVILWPELFLVITRLKLFNLFVILAG